MTGIEQALVAYVQTVLPAIAGALVFTGIVVVGVLFARAK